MVSPITRTHTFFMTYKEYKRRFKNTILKNNTIHVDNTPTRTYIIFEH